MTENEAYPSTFTFSLLNPFIFCILFLPSWRIQIIVHTPDMSLTKGYRVTVTDRLFIGFVELMSVLRFC